MRLLRGVCKYIRDDWQSSPLRVVAEIFAWVCSVVSAILFAVTAPNIPIIPIYTIFMSGATAAAWAAYTRGSFGLLANYIFIVSIDGMGLIRMLYFTGGQ
jgi:hypothetical protein